MINRNIISVLILFTTLYKAEAQSVFQNVVNRDKTTLNGKWHYIVDPYETGYYDYRYMPRDQNDNPGRDAFFTYEKQKNKWDKLEYDFDLSPTLYVPGDWNSQDDKLLYYEGSLWYKKSFDYTKKNPQNRVFINFGAVNYRADVYLNGEKLGIHEGGFTPFYFEVTDIIKPAGNFLILKVDNKRRKEAVPTLNTDWWNYGGITRDVDIIETGPVYISDYLIQLKPVNRNIIKGYIRLDGNDIASKQVTISIPELKVTEKVITDKNGYAEFESTAKNINYWSPEDPKLYKVTFKYGDDILYDRIGLRTISVSGTEILLNEKPVFLRGICIHEEVPTDGRRAYSIEDAFLLLNWAKELGCNFVRLAHYPHNENMVRLADELGIMVWEETPVYWTIAFANEETYQTAEKQLKEIISRDKNRASVIIWSMANETPPSETRLNFLVSLSKITRDMDASRLITAALERDVEEGDVNTYNINDPFANHVDIISFNEYVGWYDGLPERCERINWKIDFEKPVIVSEFGGGALQGFHGDSLTIWSEEYQEYIYKKNLEMLMNISQLRGMSPWILADFRSPKRLLPNIQDGWNRKGVISEKGEKKKAYYILKAFYEKTGNKPFSPVKE